MTRLAALKQAIIALRIEKPVFAETRFLELMINICGDDKMVLVLN